MRLVLTTCSLDENAYGFRGIQEYFLAALLGSTSIISWATAGNYEQTSTPEHHLTKRKEMHLATQATQLSTLQYFNAQHQHQSSYFT